MKNNRSGHNVRKPETPSSLSVNPSSSFARILFLSFTLIALFIPIFTLTRSSALSLSRLSFDARWEQIQLAAGEDLDADTAEDIPEQGLAKLAALNEAQLEEAEPAPTMAVNCSQLEELMIEGEIQKHTLELPAVQTPWVVRFTHFFLDDAADSLPQVEIELIPSGEGVLQIEAPEDFLIESGSVTVDPFSQPPMVKISGLPGKRIHTDDFKMKLLLPANEVSVEGAMGLKLSGGDLSELSLNLMGAIELTATDLQVDELLMRSANDGSIILGGSADFASLDLSSATRIDAQHLDTHALNVRFDNTVTGTLGQSERTILEGPESAVIAPPDGEWVWLSD